MHWKTKEFLVRGFAFRGKAGFANVSCLAEQAKILFAEAEENNLSAKVLNERWGRWHTCSLCEQYYHGVVQCALGWACWKTYLGRPETDQLRRMGMAQLGNGLFFADRYEEALSVREAELAMKRRLGDLEHNILAAQDGIARTYASLGLDEEALHVKRDVYSGFVRIYGEEHGETLRAALNYVSSLNDLKRFEEAKRLMRKTMPVARRVHGEDHDSTLKSRWIYARALYKDPASTLDDLREAVSTLEETTRIARRVLGGAHPITTGIGGDLQNARAVLHAREMS